MIALQIDRWNEESKAQLTEQKYLIALKKEFENNLKGVNDRLELCTSVFEGCRTILSRKNQFGEEISELEFTTACDKAFRDIPNFTESPGILNDLTSSGNLSKLSNDKLRSEIQLWFINVQIVEDSQNHLIEFGGDIVAYLYKELSVRNILVDFNETTIGELEKSDFEVDVVRIFNDHYFDNLVIGYSLIIKDHQNDIYPMLITNIESILEEIDNSLNSR